MIEEMRIVTYTNGVPYVTDTRTVEGQKPIKIAQLKEAASARILVQYPIFKQINAALGVYSAEVAQAITDGIIAARMEVNAKEAAINACETLDELDGLDL